GREIVDDANPEKVPNGMGNYNSILTIKSPDSAKVFLHKYDFAEQDNNVILSFAVSGKDLLQKEVPPQFHLSKTNIIALFNNEQISGESISTMANRVLISLNKDLLKGYKTIRVAVNKNGGHSNI